MLIFYIVSSLKDSCFLCQEIHNWIIRNVIGQYLLQQTLMLMRELAVTKSDGSQEMHLQERKHWLAAWCFFSSSMIIIGMERFSKSSFSLKSYLEVDFETIPISGSLLFGMTVNVIHFSLGCPWKKTHMYLSVRKVSHKKHLMRKKGKNPYSYSSLMYW